MAGARGGEGVGDGAAAAAGADGMRVNGARGLGPTGRAPARVGRVVQEPATPALGRAREESGMACA